MFGNQCQIYKYIYQAHSRDAVRPQKSKIMKLSTQAGRVSRRSDSSKHAYEAEVQLKTSNSSGCSGTHHMFLSTFVLLLRFIRCTDFFLVVSFFFSHPST